MSEQTQISITNVEIADAEKILGDYLLGIQPDNYTPFDRALSVLLKNRINLTQLLTLIGFVGHKIDVKGGDINIRLSFQGTDTQSVSELVPNIIATMPHLFVLNSLGNILRDFIDTHTDLPITIDDAKLLLSNLEKYSSIPKNG